MPVAIAFGCLPPAEPRWAMMADDSTRPNPTQIAKEWVRAVDSDEHVDHALIHAMHRHGYHIIDDRAEPRVYDGSLARYWYHWEVTAYATLEWETVQRVVARTSCPKDLQFAQERMRDLLDRHPEIIRFEVRKSVAYVGANK